MHVEYPKMSPNWEVREPNTCQYHSSLTWVGSGNNLVTDLITWLPSGSNLAISNEKKLSKHMYVRSSFAGIITAKPTMSTDRQSDTRFER